MERKAVFSQIFRKCGTSAIAELQDGGLDWVREDFRMSEAGSLSLMAESLVRLAESLERIEGSLADIASSLDRLAPPPVRVELGGSGRPDFAQHSGGV